MSNSVVDIVFGHVRMSIDARTATRGYPTGGRQVASSQSIVDDILFWRPKAAPEKLVDANAEAKRLRENAAAGKAPADGEIPTIKRKKVGILDGLFN